MSWRNALFRAANEIREHGWCQGVMANHADNVCAVGAISDATNTENEMVKAVKKLSQFLGGLDVAEWNDAPGRTKDEVISALLQAAGKE